MKTFQEFIEYKNTSSIIPVIAERLSASGKGVEFFEKLTNSLIDAASNSEKVKLINLQSQIAEGLAQAIGTTAGNVVNGFRSAANAYQNTVQPQQANAFIQNLTRLMNDPSVVNNPQLKQIMQNALMTATGKKPVVPQPQVANSGPLTPAPNTLSPAAGGFPNY